MKAKHNEKGLNYLLNFIHNFIFGVPMAYLILDIETIPLPPIDDEVEALIAKKVQARIEKTGDDPENAESLIRSTSPIFGVQKTR